ncbi:SDR family oxidoreductase [Pseudonocardia ailaonensis]|uniref:SDR family oxidoreductase n=1 Tax=Pseudonocardia ailaonensis TaxID=367279 RepID=A0ABN2N5G4_9PSEU
MTVGAGVLEGRTALVVGGVRGIGRAITEGLLDAGAAVVATSRDAPPTDLAHHRLGFGSLDVRDPESVRLGIDAAATVLGRLDVVVVVAGISRPGPVDSASPQDWQEVLSTNVIGTALVVRAAVPHLTAAGGGRILTLSSALATRITPGAASYSAAKAAIEAYTRVAAAELAPRGILVNCLAPGFIDAGMGRELAANEVVWQRYAPKLSAGRLGTAEEVAAAAVFLAGPGSAYVGGHVLEVNGGLVW